MTEFTLTYTDKGRCSIGHSENDTEIITDLPKEYGGRGRSFSSTDMVCAAVGSCYLTTIEEILRRSHYDLGNVTLAVKKSLQQQPKKISAVRMVLHLPEAPSAKLETQLIKSISLCPVKRSLNSDIEVSLTFTTSAP